MRVLLASSKGNVVRYFPYSGYLGLTPVKIEGVVITRFDQNQKTLTTRNITIAARCYELIQGPTGVLHSNVLDSYTKTLWEGSTTGNGDYGELGEVELPFRLSIPPSSSGLSTATYVEYRCVWRVEAVVNHVPIPGIGNRIIRHCELPLIRFNSPPIPTSIRPPLPDGVQPTLDRETKKPRAPRIRYTIVSPSVAVGPLDLVPISLFLLPESPTTSIRSASAVIERRIAIRDPASISPVPPSTLGQTSSQDSFSSTLHGSTFTNSSATITPELLHLQRPVTATSTQPADLRVSTHPIAATESSGPFAHGDQKGVLFKTLTIPWPVPSSNGRWTIGETTTTDIASVQFFVRAKVIITSPSGTESLDLEEQEILVVPTNGAERELALSEYQDARRRAKSKSPRRSRTKENDAVPVSPSSTSPTPVPTLPSSPVQGPVASSSGSAAHSRPNHKTSRRPHTSAGPRDSTTKFSYATPAGHTTSDHQKRGKSSRPGTSELTGAGPIRTSRDSLYAGRPFSPSSVSTSASAIPRNMAAVVTTLPQDSTRASAEIREWEQELARIEVQSRRSSDLLGFSIKRFRPRMLLGKS